MLNDINSAWQLEAEEQQPSLPSERSQIFSYIFAELDLGTPPGEIVDDLLPAFIEERKFKPLSRADRVGMVSWARKKLAEQKIAQKEE